MTPAEQASHYRLRKAEFEALAAQARTDAEARFWLNTAADYEMQAQQVEGEVER